MKKILICLLFLPGIMGALFAQTSNKVLLDSNSTYSVGCIGTSILLEDFEGGIPAGWEVWDMDSLDPASSLGMIGGWQAVSDFMDSTDNAVASPSWYVPPGSSEDWLISPQFILNGPTCFSWEAYSLDSLFPEQYEVRLVPASGNPADFLSIDPIYTDSATSGQMGVYSVVVDGFTNDTFRLAFRQFSSDDYVLVLDEVHITSISTRDASVFELDSLVIEANDTVFISGSIANAGSETLESVLIEYNVDGGTVFSMLIDSLGLEPFKACAFTHSTPWTTSSLGTFNFCAWTRLPNTLDDLNTVNDTTCQEMEVTTILRVENELNGQRIELFPQPAHDQLNIAFERGGDSPSRLNIFALTGQKVMDFPSFNIPGKIDLLDLPGGFYILEVELPDHSRIQRRIMVQ